MAPSRSYSILALVALLSGCDGISEPRHGPPAAIEAIAGDGESIPVGTSIPVRVKVTDASGRPVRDATVQWSVIRFAGGGFRPAGESIDPLLTKTDSKGEAEAVVTLGTKADRYNIAANLQDGDHFASLNVYGIPGPAALIWPDTTGSPVPIAVRGARRLFGMDFHGNPIANPSGTWRSSDTAVATVDTSGVVIARGIGSATITRSHAGASASARIEVPPPARFRSLTVHGAHACGLTEAGEAYCWGGAERSSGTGGFGAGLPAEICALQWHVRHEHVDISDHRDCYTHPVPVQGGLTFLGITTGARTTCGIATNRATYCWGAETGSGAASDRPVPVAGGHDFVAIAAGFGHVCALSAEGRPYCWGSGPGSSTPIPVAGVPALTSISARAMHTCGLTEAGAAHCWKAYPDSMPAPVGGGLTFISLSAGDHHVCGITDAGTGYCWGSNHAGQLGDGTTEASPTPVAVVGELEFATISAGANHTCALTTAGEAYCWGDNGHYQLGTGGDSPHPPREPVPVAVKGGLRFREIQASGTGVWLYGSFTCGVTTGFETYCWGSNMAGQMGNRLHASVIPLEGALGLQPLPAGIFPAGTFPVPD